SAQTLLSNIELMRLELPGDDMTPRERIEQCYEAVTELCDLLKMMKVKNLYAAEPYLPSHADSQGILSLSGQQGGQCVTGV
ncbi:MAG: hypothetical protein WCK89_17105, partial [bacterium]